MAAPDESEAIKQCRTKFQQIQTFEKSWFGSMLSKIGGTNLDLYRESAYFMSQNISQLTNPLSSRFGSFDSNTHETASNSSSVIHNVLCDNNVITEDRSHSIETCGNVHRLVNTINIYQQSIINLELDEVKTTEILDDYMHLLENHNNDTDFEYICQQFEDCNPFHCGMLHNVYRDRNKERKFEYNYYQQILNKIHCFYQHSVHIGLSLAVNDKNMIQKSRDQFAMKNNAVTIIKDITSKQVQNVKAMMINKNYQKYHVLQNYVKKKVCPSKQYQMYSFGVQFKYNNRGKCSKKQILVAAKYKSLKEELLQNEISRLSMEQFVNECKKAILHFNGYMRKNRYPKLKSPLILCLMIYCNFDTFQYEFSRTYRDNIEQHNNFYYFAKFIKHAIDHCGGIAIHNGSITKFYHGIGQKLLFPDVTGIFATGVSIYCPMSTTTSMTVAVSFTNFNQGMVVEFGNGWKLNSAKYLPLAWLSDFPREQECLFISPAIPLQINNILEVDTGYEFKNILIALAIIDYIISGSLLKENITDNMELLISAIFAHQLSYFNRDYQRFYSLHPYASQLIDLFFKNKIDCVILDYSIKHYSFLYQMLFYSEYDWIELSLMRDLFPNIHEIWFRNIQFDELILQNIIHYFKDPNRRNINIKISSYNTNNKWVKYKNEFSHLNYTIKENDGIIAIEAIHTKASQLFNCMKFIIASLIVIDVRILILCCGLMDSIMQNNFLLFMLFSMFGPILSIKLQFEEVDAQQECPNIMEDEDLWWIGFLYLIGTPISLFFYWLAQKL